MRKKFGLGDARLSARLVEIASAKAEKPGHAFGGVVEGDLPAVKAYYRLIDHPDEQGEFALHQNPRRYSALTPKGGQTRKFLL